MAVVSSFEHEIRPARSDAEGAIVLLHGRGTNRFDLIPLLDELDPDRRFVGVTPQAPLELMPGGFHWYISRQVGHPDAPTFNSTYEGLAAWLEVLSSSIGVPWSHTIIGGFSMGAVMSYALGLGRGRPNPAAILAFSGFMPTVEGFELDLAGREIPVAIGHGTQDPIISVDFSRDARRRLESAGVRLRYHESPMPHAIDPEFVYALREWIVDVLPASGQVG